MFYQMRSSRRRQEEDNRPPRRLSRSEKIRFAIVFGILLTGLGLLLTDMFVLGEITHIDSVVVNKEYLPPSHGQTSTGAGFNVDERWTLSFNIHGNIFEAKVGHQFYDQTNISEILKVTYTRSPIFHRIEIASVTR